MAIRLLGTTPTELEEAILKEEEVRFLFQCDEAHKSGRYPIDVAAKLIALKGGVGVSVEKMEERLTLAAMDRSLPVYEFGQNVRWNGDMPILSLLDIYESDLKNWLEIEEPRVDIFSSTKTISINKEIENVEKPLPRQRFQENEIFRVIKELGFNAKALPKRVAGKPGAKALVRKKLKFTVGVFNKAWERLRANKDIQDE